VVHPMWARSMEKVSTLVFINHPSAPRNKPVA